MPPYLPNETVTTIFEYVYDSLCIHPAQVEPDFPIGAKLVYSRFSLVSKRFHSLALPFLVRHFDGNDVEAFTDFVKKYNLASSVKSFYLNPTFKGYQDPENFAEDCREMELPEIEAQEMSQLGHDYENERELDGWIGIIDLCGGSLTKLEVGSRRRNKSEQGAWYGEIQSGTDYMEDDDSLYFDTAPAPDLVPFVNKLPRNHQLTSLVLNLPSEPLASSEKARYEDQQFASAISKRFPNLREYTIHFHNTFDLEERSTPVALSGLTRLRILNLRTDSRGLRKNLRPTYLAPSATTLTHLEIQIVSSDQAQPLSPNELFGNLTFPSLKTLIIDSPVLSCTQFDFFNRFPQLLSTSIPLAPEHTQPNTIPFLPHHLRSLTLSRLDDNSLDSLAHYLRRVDLSKLARLSLQGSSDSMSEVRTNVLPWFETQENILVEVATIVRIYSRSQVDVYHSNALAEDNPISDLRAGTALSEDGEFDYDAEDDEQFRPLWSEEKKRSYDIDQGFAKFRYWLQSDHAEVQAKSAIESYLK
ncbi:hypothetical protein JCM5353_005225 [Sporobolomyces roseus]